MLLDDDYGNVYVDPMDQAARKSKCEPSIVNLEQNENYQMIKGLMDAYDCDSFYDLKFVLETSNEDELNENLNEMSMDLFNDLINDTIDHVINPENKQYITVKKIIGDNNTIASDDDVENYKKELSQTAIDAILANDKDDAFEPTNFIAVIIDEDSKQFDTSQVYHEFIVSNNLELARPAPPPTNQFSPAKQYNYDGPKVQLEYMNKDGSPKTHVEFKHNKSFKPTMH